VDLVVQVKLNNMSNVAVKTKFFTFRQNNSFGIFHLDDKRGIGELVIIEANDADHANALAEDIGLYFDGCSIGTDCPCCGDRWNPAWSNEGTIEPEAYGKPLSEYESWFTENAYIHYLNNTIERVSIRKNKEDDNS